MTTEQSTSFPPDAVLYKDEARKGRRLAQESLRKVALLLAARPFSHRHRNKHAMTMFGPLQATHPKRD